MSLAGPAANLALVVVAGVAIRLLILADVLEAPGTIHFTQVAVSTAGGVWSTLATFTLLGNEDTIRGGNFTAHLRHEFRVSTDVGDAIVATGVRLIVPESGLGGGTAIDRIAKATEDTARHTKTLTKGKGAKFK